MKNALFNETISQELVSVNKPLDASTIRVRLLPDLSAAAFRSKQTRQLALWHCLRALNPSGTGIIDRSKAIEQLREVFNYSERTVYEHLALSEGSFFETQYVSGRTRIVFKGIKRVSLHLDTPLDGNRHFREVGPDDFNTIEKRPAQLYASILPPEGIYGNPISRQSITEYTGLTEQQQRRYDKVAGIRRVYSPGVRIDEKRISYDSEGKRIERPADSPLGGMLTKDTVQLFMTVQNQGKDIQIPKRLPNCYRTHQQPCGKGMVKRIARELSRSLITGEAQGVTRRYFSGFRRCIKALSKRGEGLHEGWAKVTPPYRLIKGRQEWGLVSICI